MPIDFGELSNRKVKKTIKSLIKKGYLKMDKDKNISLTPKGLELGLELDFMKKEGLL